MDTKFRVITNSLWNVAGRAVFLIVGLFLTPFMLGRLGGDAYGVMILVMSVLPFLDIFTVEIATSVGRYVTFYQARNEIDEANRYFNTSFFAALALCGIASLPIAFLTICFPRIFDVRGWERASQWTMLLGAVSFIVTAVTGPFAVGLYFRQKFRLRNIFDVTALFARTGTIVLLLSLASPSPSYVAIGMIVAALIQGAANVATAFRTLPGLHISSQLFSAKKLREVTAFSFYLMISRISVYLFLSTDYILINLLFGKKWVTVYNMGAQWVPQLRNFVMAAVFVVGPLVTILDATDERERIRSIFLRGSRALLLILCPVAFFSCALVKPFMALWVGRQLTRVSPAAIIESVKVFWVLMLPLVVNLSVSPAFTMFTAMGRVKTVALVTLVAAVSNVFLSIWFASGLGLGIVGIALGSTVCLSAKNAAFVPWYVGRLCKATARDFYRLFPGPLLASLPGTLFAVLIQYVIDIKSWLPLILVGGCCLLSYLVIVYLWCLTDQEKQELFSIWSRIRAALRRRQVLEHE